MVHVDEGIYHPWSMEVYIVRSRYILDTRLYFRKIFQGPRKKGRGWSVGEEQLCEEDERSVQWIRGPSVRLYIGPSCASDTARGGAVGLEGGRVERDGLAGLGHL
jgi:hypothetical protein